MTSENNASQTKFLKRVERLISGQYQLIYFDEESYSLASKIQSQGDGYNTRVESEKNEEPYRKRTTKAIEKFNLENIISKLNATHCKSEIVNILDIGCADGKRTKKYVDAIVNAGYKVNMIGLEYNKVSATKAKSTHEDMNIVIGDMRALPFKEDYFDVVLNLYGSVGFVNHEDKKKTFQEINRTLKKGGLFCVDLLARELISRDASWGRTNIPEEEGRNYMLYLADFKNPDNKSFLITYLFSKNEIDSYLNNAGFQIIKIQQLDPNTMHPEYAIVSTKK